MSFTLTGRDTNTLSMVLAKVGADGNTFHAAENSATNVHQLRIRHQGSVTGPGTRRANIQLERRVFDATTKKWFGQKVDITLAEDTQYAWTADDADDLVTLATSYFDSEGTTGQWQLGGGKA